MYVCQEGDAKVERAGVEPKTRARLERVVLRCNCNIGECLCMHGTPWAEVGTLLHVWAWGDKSQQHHQPTLKSMQCEQIR